MASQGIDAPGIRSGIKDAIRRESTGDEGAPVSSALETAAAISGSREDLVRDEFEEMKKRGEVYVVPAEDEGRVKVTP